MSKQEEVMMEVEAVRSVYGDDCTVLSPYPPHFRVHVVPRTADVTSQQFVDADIEIRAGSLYPDVPPTINIVDSKGLDEARLEHLQSSLHKKATELASCLMLVALCEEAIERITAMNHPDGNCPLCLYPLFLHEDESKSLPFMKLMSCFHCFHSDCIIRWWKWLQMQNDHQNRSSRMSSSIDKNFKDNMRSCPICRKGFHVEDFEHVINLAGSQMAELALEEKYVVDGEKLIVSDLETSRRHQFEAILLSQKECGGIIEPRKDGLLFSSISITDLVVDATPEICSETLTQTIAQNQRGEKVKDKPESSSLSSVASKRKQLRGSRPVSTKQDSFLHSDRSQVSKPILKHEPYGGSFRPSASQPKHRDRRKDARAPPTQSKQWIKKERDGDT